MRTSFVPVVAEMMRSGTNDSRVRATAAVVNVRRGLGGPAGGDLGEQHADDGAHERQLGETGEGDLLAVDLEGDVDARRNGGDGGRGGGGDDADPDTGAPQRRGP